MRNKVAIQDPLRLFLTVAKAAIIVTVGVFALGFAVMKLALSRPQQEIAGGVMAFLPVGLAARWLFRDLQPRGTRREARAAAIAFAIFTPAALLGALIIGPFVGGNFGVLLGDRLAFPGELVGVVVMIAVASFATVVIALRIARRTSPRQAGDRRDVF